ncbi:murein hydrolase activator EnvC family protein [Nafulsella turpanensis]|uniref:murein hydrolase activator EnvC family protein n=1 Tax=Nafulsella turpanensis TaxID=1265690 RepID=UPI0003464083|nr:peptidoglycan DD-metalloendopeptidase family protein [Nafulsella turpanensis]
MTAKIRGAGSVVFVLFFLFVLPAAAQTKAELEKRKQENQKKIEEAEKILEQTRDKKEATLGQLSALNNKIEASQELILLLNKEVGMLDGEINQLGGIVKALQKDLEQLKDEYAQMVYTAYKANKGFSKLTFIFSASTFNELFMRLNWMEQYGEARRMQVEQITKVRESLQQQQKNVQSKRQKQEEVLAEQLNQSQQLLALKQEQSQVVSQLNARENKIKSDIAERKSNLKRLDDLIAKLVREEIERARAEAAAAEAARKKATKSSGAADVPLTPEVASLSTSFEGARSKLLWPVASGFISTQFGTNQVYKQVKLESSGVEIQTKENENVRAVFDGQVRRVFFMPGMNNVVMIQHGQYFTVYARLKEVNVEPMQKIKAKDVLGKVYTNNDGTSEVHFEIWKNNQKLDPEEWLFKN